MKISASFLSIKDNLKNSIVKLDHSAIDYLHLDIMDNKFVPNITWSFDEIKELLDETNKPKDVHLMVEDVIKYVDLYSLLNPEYITFHLEAVENIRYTIEYIKSKKIKVGISIKPNTSVDELLEYLGDIDLVLVMSVEPGFGGQKFIDNSIQKVNKLSSIRKQHNYNYLIEIDGGINDANIQKLDKTDIVVVGSYITNSDNYDEAISRLKNC